MLQHCSRQAAKLLASNAAQVVYAIIRLKKIEDEACNSSKSESHTSITIPSPWLMALFQRDLCKRHRYVYLYTVNTSFTTSSDLMKNECMALPLAHCIENCLAWSRCAATFVGRFIPLGQVAQLEMNADAVRASTNEVAQIAIPAKTTAGGPIIYF